MFNLFVPTSEVVSAGVVVSEYTSTFVTGDSCKRIEWTDAIDGTYTMAFDSIDLSEYEEISFYIFMGGMFPINPAFTISINGVEFPYGSMRQSDWLHALIDCSDLGPTTSIAITSNVANLILMLDVFGYRKATYNKDIDLLQAFQTAIVLDYDVATVLAADAVVGDTSISFTSAPYIYDETTLLLNNGTESETVYLTSKSGELKEALQYNYTIGDVVKAICPTLLENYDDVQPDPVCGVMAFDKVTDKQWTETPMYGQYNTKLFTGALGIFVYIDCHSKKKLLQLSREYDFKFGERFEILLDGELVTVILDETNFLDNVIGNNPRMSYTYYVEPQPTLFRKAGNRITDFTIEGGSVSPLDMTIVKNA